MTFKQETMMRKFVAEFIGTMFLVLGGCGAAVLSAKFGGADASTLGIGLVGVSLAFGLSVVALAYALGPISGGHFNPAVTLGLVVAGRCRAADILPYWAAQIAGAVAGAALLAALVNSHGDYNFAAGFAANGYGVASPGNYPLAAAFLSELTFTFLFLMVILGITSPRAANGFAPLAIGLTLTLIHLVSIPITNTSVNPARSLSQALFAGGNYVSQLWLFWLAPLLGAAAAGLVGRWLYRES